MRPLIKREGKELLKICGNLGLLAFFCSFAGKNDGSVKGVRYFSCGAKRGVFVRPDKVMLDKRGRTVRNNNPTKQENNGVMRRSVSKGKR